MNLRNRAVRSGAVRIAEVGDSELFTGREMKALLRVLLGDAATRDRWLKLEEAAQRMMVNPPALRKRCMRWAAQQNPLVLVRKMSDADGSHWLLLESDVDRLCSRINARRSSDEPASPPAPQATDIAMNSAEATTEDALLEYWADRISQDT